MIYKLIGGLITTIIGVSLLDVMNDAISPLTGTGGTYEATTVGALLDLLPTMFVIILVVAVVVLIPKKSGA